MYTFFFALFGYASDFSRIDVLEGSCIDLAKHRLRHSFNTFTSSCLIIVRHLVCAVASTTTKLGGQAVRSNGLIAPYPSASRIFPLISSMSRAFRAGKGRFIPSRETMGSSIPSTVTTKFPFPGYDLFWYSTKCTNTIGYI